MSKTNIILIIILLLLVAFLAFRSLNTFPIPSGTTEPLEENMEEEVKSVEVSTRGPSTRKIFVTDDVKHSIPLDEIFGGGPPKDGIPAINEPKFISTKEADEYLDDNEDIGLGLLLGGEARFYPYQILVYHEIVNDFIGDDPVLVTYCPLCGTGVVFNRRVNGKAEEFGVSGRLWQSNLLMYNRAENEEDETLWSQVLGEAVLGTHTGDRLDLIPADTVKYGDWKDAHPDTEVLSRETGFLVQEARYGRDPYGSYYTERSLIFPVSNEDNRLHPKDFVLGIEIGGKYKAYLQDSLEIGITKDNFAGKEIILEKSASGEVTITSNGGEIPHLDGFWFSWFSVHPETELYN